MQATSDIFSGWLSVKQERGDGQPRDFLRAAVAPTGKGSVDITAMTPEGLARLYGRLCGATLARAHARSGDRIAIAAYLGAGRAFDQAILAFSDAYADQNERDYAALSAAVASRRVAATTGL